MLNLPFDKWSLRFYDPEFESQYEDHLNKIRLVSFQILNLTISVAVFICLLTFIIQEQQTILIIMLSITLAANVFQMIVSKKKIIPYLKSLFSFYYVWALIVNILIADVGCQIPNFIFGFNTCTLAIGTMQYSDNKLKVVFTILTPFILMGIFDIYKVNTLAFVFQTISCTFFIGILSYMNEYTSRLAFSLNLISNKQKDLINEFVNDALFALSLNKRTRQFVLEFQNNRFIELMKIKETEQMKSFLRSTFIIVKSNETQSKQRERNSTRMQTLEEVFFTKLKSYEKSFNFKDEQDTIYEIYQQDLINNETKKMCLQIKFLNFGKPIIIAIIKSEKVPNLIHRYESSIKEYQKIILNMSCKIVKKQQILQEEIKKIKFQHITEQQQLQCLNLTIINYVRNFILFFQKNKITEMKFSLQNCKFHSYISIINQYFQTVSNSHSIKFTLENYVSLNCSFNINLNYLSQILINIFDELIKFTIKNNLIKLRIIEEFQQNHYFKRQTTQRIQQNDNSSIKLKLIQFRFMFLSDEYLNLKNLSFNQRFNYNDQQYTTLEDGSIISEITCILLDNIGPNKNIIINQFQTPQMSSIQNTIQFFIYSDQSLLEPSYYKVYEKPTLH